MRNLIGGFAYGGPCVKGSLRLKPEDFQVEEQLGFSLTGDGEHVFCHIKKEGWNTESVARKLAAMVGVPLKQVSYAGLKDKHAMTTQWFSIHLPGKVTPTIVFAKDDGIELLAMTRHNKKLKRGALRANQFVIRVKHVEGDSSALQAKLNQIAQCGFPNYFGEQRFGIDGQNVEAASKMLLDNQKVKSRHLRGIYLSAARAYLFNKALDARVEKGFWCLPLKGDVMQLSGSHSVFVAHDIDEEITRRVEDGDLSPAGPLWGLGEQRETTTAKDFLDSVFDCEQKWLDAVKRFGTSLTYRAYRVVPQNLQWNWVDANTVQFSFLLPAGSFATALIREVVEYD